MVVVRYLRGLGQGRYVVINSGMSLYNNINKYTGIRRLAEVVSLWVSFCLYSPFKKKSQVVGEIYKRLPVLRKEYGYIDCGFFLDTSWYKDSYFVGCIACGCSQYFVKCFKVNGETEKERDNQRLVSNIYNEYFCFASIDYLDNYIISYELIPNNGEQCSFDYMWNAAAVIYKLTSAEGKRVFLSELSRDLSASLKVIDLPEDIISHVDSAILQLNSSAVSIPCVFCHGDYTTWNSVVDIDNPSQKYLVDYERASDRVIYTDIFHLFTQKSCLELEDVDFMKKLTQLSNEMEMPLDYIASSYLGYLMEELLENLEEWRNGKNHIQLRNLIEQKLLLLIQCISCSRI